MIESTAVDTGEQLMTALRGVDASRGESKRFETAISELARALKSRIAALGEGGLKPGEEDLEAVRSGLELSEDVAGIWLDTGAVLRLERLYVSSLAASTRDRLGRVAAFEDLLRVVRLRARVGDPGAAAELIDERTLDEARRHAPTDVALALTTARADLRRTQGDFVGALRDLERARTLCTDGSASAAAVAHMHRTELKLEIDLGRLERAREASRQIDAVTATMGTAERSEMALRSRLSKALYLSACGHIEPVKRLSRSIFEDLAASGSGSPATLRLRAVTLGNWALALAREANQPNCSQEIRDRSRVALERALESNLLDAALRLTLELHWLLEGPAVEDQDELRGNLERALTLVQAVESPLRRGTAAAQVHRIARERSQPTIRARAEGIMRAATSPIVRTWEDVARLPGGVGFLEFEDRQLFVAELLESRLLENDVHGAFADLLAFDACSSIAVRRGAVPDPDAILSLARDCGATLIATLPANGTTHVFRWAPVEVNGEEDEQKQPEWRLTHLEAPGPGTLAPLIEAHRRAVALRPLPRRKDAERPTGDVEGEEAWTPAPASVKLGQELLGAALPGPLDSGSPLWLSGLDRLGIIAPSALHLRTDGEPIGLLAPVALIPSLAALPALLPTRAQVGNRTGSSIFALSGVPHDLARIDLTLAERRALTSASPGPVTWHLGQKATPARLIETLTTPAALAVVWTHGSPAKGRPYPTALAAAPPKKSRLTKRVYGLDVQRALEARRPDAGGPGVVILSCCESGAGKRRSGDPAAGQFVGILLGGATSCVLAAPADLHREATAELLVGFTRAWSRDGVTVEQALLEARRSLTATYPRYRAPHYWATLEVHGLGRVTR